MESNGKRYGIRWWQANEGVKGNSYAYGIENQNKVGASRYVNGVEFAISPSQKWLNSIFDPEVCAMFWNLWKKQISDF